MKTIKLTMLAITALLAVSSCKKEKNPTQNTVDVNENMVILNEGEYEVNNASISFKGANSDVENNKFFEVNSRELGATANDIATYQGNIYIILNVSETIEVINEATFESVATISMTGKSPRNIVFENNMAYVSNYNGTVSAINTNDFSIIKDITVGANPEGLAISNDKLYVANSGGLESEKDSTISVIDLVSLEEIEKINVGKNLKKILVYNNSLYITSATIYSNWPEIETPATLFQYTPSSNIIDTISLTVECKDFMIDNGDAFVYDGSEIKSFNLTSNILGNSVQDLAEITTFYGFGKTESGFYITDAANYTIEGNVSFYDNNWKLSGSLEVGMVPKEVLVLD